MTGTDQAFVERTLTEVLHTQPSADGLRVLDARVAAATAIRRSSSVAQRHRPSRRRTLAVGLLTAAAVTAGAGGALGLYDGMGAGMDYGFSIQLARSVPIDATAVDEGFRVTIDRAYLDGERLMLAVRAEDERKRPEVTQVMAMYSLVTDDAGSWQGAGAATSRPLGQWVAANIQWHLAPQPVAAGVHQLHVEIPRIRWRDASLVEADREDPWRDQAGRWSFDIQVPVDGGATAIRPAAVLSIEGADFVVEEVVIGRSSVRLRITYDDPGATWALFGAVRRPGDEYPFVQLSHDEPGVIEIQTDGGAEDAFGPWSIEIREAERQVGDGAGERIVGPWTVEVSVP